MFMLLEAEANASARGVVIARASNSALGTALLLLLEGVRAAGAAALGEGARVGRDDDGGAVVRGGGVGGERACEGGRRAGSARRASGAGRGGGGGSGGGRRQRRRRRRA